jgi:hypothetical protein
LVKIAASKISTNLDQSRPISTNLDQSGPKFILSQARLPKVGKLPAHELGASMLDRELLGGNHVEDEPDPNPACAIGFASDNT